MTNHRLTAKAAGALRVMFETSGEDPAWLLPTHEHVENAYNYLAGDGYVWDKKAQEWKFVGLPQLREVMRLYLSVEAKDQADALRLMEDGAIICDLTIGKVTRMEIVMHNGAMGVMFEIECVK